MLLDSAETLFLTAKARVYGAADKKTKKQKTDEKAEENLFDFDVNPKWLALSEIMSDIKKEIEENQVPEQLLKKF
jgi:hypothetical protein